MEMFSLVWRHVLVPVCVGARHLTVAHNFVAAIHAVRLEASSFKVTIAICERIIQLLTDYGTEAHLSFVPAFDLPSIFLTGWTRPRQ